LRRIVASASEKSGGESLKEKNSSPAASTIETGRSGRPSLSSPN